MHLQDIDLEDSIEGVAVPDRCKRVCDCELLHSGRDAIVSYVSGLVLCEPDPSKFC